MISDPFWKQSLLEAVPIEDGCYGSYKMLLVASDKPVGTLIYPFRMFFSQNDIIHAQIEGSPNLDSQKKPSIIGLRRESKIASSLTTLPY